MTAKAMSASSVELISAKGEIDAQTSAPGTACFERTSHNCVVKRREAVFGEWQLSFLAAMKRFVRFWLAADTSRERVVEFCKQH